MNIPLWIINQFVLFVFDKVSTAIRITADKLNRQEYDRKHFFNSLSIGPAQIVVQRAIKMSRISSQSVIAWSNYILHFEQLC